jgi:ferredoxin
MPPAVREQAAQAGVLRSERIVLDRIRQHAPAWLRRAKWHASDIMWSANWRAIRAFATPWARPQYEAARAKLSPTTSETSGAAATNGAAATTTAHERVVLSRDVIDGWLRDAAPPQVPFDAVVLKSSELRKRFGAGPLERRSLHQLGTVRMTHRSIPTESVLVLVLFSDVAADYFVESMAADVASRANDAYGAGVAFADSQASVPILLKETAVAAGLGTIGKNALFFSRRFGFNCKLNVVFLNAAVDRYDAAPVDDGWKLPDCSTCNLCVEACPVSAFDDYVITRTESCDRLIAGDFFGPRRDHMCRACITRCPVSNDVLKLRRSEGVPRRAFWDNEAQLALVADLFMYKPSFLVWLIQRFYYGSELPGRATDKKKGYRAALSSAPQVTTTERTRDGWRLTSIRRR